MKAIAWIRRLFASPSVDEAALQEESGVRDPRLDVIERGDPTGAMQATLREFEPPRHRQ